MKIDEILENIGTSTKLNKYLNSLDDYDDPCFILIKTDIKVNSVLKTIKSTIDSEETYSSDLINLSDNLLFICVDCEYKNVTNLVSNIDSNLNIEGAKSNIAAFRHNCLGEPKSTFSWCCLLLEEVCVNKEQYLINDFKDHGNWPGISKYVE